MVAGLDVKVSIWHRTDLADDSIGGAIVTGTATYTNVWCRFEAQMPNQLLLEQGLETMKIHRVIARPSTLQVQEFDELQITYPYSHPHYLDYFRVVGVLDTNFHPQDPRGYLILQVTRFERANVVQ